MTTHWSETYMSCSFGAWVTASRAVTRRKVFGLLVLLGFAIADFTPAAYQGRSLRPPCNEVSSWGGLRT